ncbi:MAG: hypothetical protein U9N87_07735 [Planctomycetota bacterium]|nr:hypothetical protein [Planctomycetota bacterium]
MMSDAEKPDTSNPDPPKRRLRAFQFDIRALLILTALLSVLLAVLRWMELSRGAMLLVLGIGGFSALAGAGLVIALTLTMGRGRKG